MVELTDNIKGLIKQSMNKWKTKVYSDGKLLCSLPIRRGIHFTITIYNCFTTTDACLERTEILYQLEKNGARVINHFFFMYDLKF